MAINPSNAQADAQEQFYPPAAQEISFDPDEHNGVDRLRSEAYAMMNAQPSDAESVDVGSYMDVAAEIGTGIVKEATENPLGLLTSAAIGVGTAALATVAIGTAPAWLGIAVVGSALVYAGYKAYDAISSVMDDVDVLTNKSEHTAAEIQQAEGALQDFGAGTAHVAAGLAGAPVGAVVGSAVKEPVRAAVSGLVQKAFTGTSGAVEGAAATEVVAATQVGAATAEAAVAGTTETAANSAIGGKISSAFSNISNRATAFGSKAMEVGNKAYDRLDAVSVKLVDGAYDWGARASSYAGGIAGRITPEVTSIVNSVGGSITRVAGQAAEGVTHYAGPYAKEMGNFVIARSDQAAKLWNGALNRTEQLYTVSADKIGGVYGDRVGPALTKAGNVTWTYGGKAYNFASENASRAADYTLSGAERAAARIDQVAGDAYFAMYPHVSHAYSIAKPYVDNAGRHMAGLTDNGKQYVAYVGDGFGKQWSHLVDAVGSRAIRAGERADELAVEASWQIASRARILRERMKNADDYINAPDLDDLPPAIGVALFASSGNFPTQARV